MGPQPPRTDYYISGSDHGRQWGHRPGEWRGWGGPSLPEPAPAEGERAKGPEQRILSLQDQKGPIAAAQPPKGPGNGANGWVPVSAAALIRGTGGGTEAAPAQLMTDPAKHGREMASEAKPSEARITDQAADHLIITR